MVMHDDAFDAVAVPQGIEHLDRIVDLGDTFFQQLYRLIHIGSFQLLPKLPGQVGHFIKRSALLKPGKHLTGPKRLLR